MGKSEHASFIGKLNLLLIKKQIKERRKPRNRRKQNETSEKVVKEKKHFWRRWLRFVRGRSFRQGEAQHDKKSKPASPSGDNPPGDKPPARGFPSPSSSASGDRLRPTEVKGKGHWGPKGVSRRSSKSSQAPTPQQTHSLLSVRSDGVKASPSTEASLDVSNSGGDGAEICEESGEVAEERSDSIKEGSTSEQIREKSPKSEKLFTCSPCVCEEPENVIEIAVTFEPGQPEETEGSKTGDEIKFISIKEKPGSYKNLGRPSGHSLKTLKSISEPAWNEKYKILQQQELKENLKDLLQQFLILESRVEAVCSDSLTKTAESGSEILFDADSTLSSETFNQVSPEVLVNIKPFKTFVSEGYLTGDDASSSKYRAKHEGHEGKKRSHKRTEIWNGPPEKKRAAPCLLLNRFSMVNELEKVEASCYRDGTPSPPLKELEPRFVGLENYEPEPPAETHGTMMRKLPVNSFWVSQKAQLPSGDGKREEVSERQRKDSKDPPCAKDVDEVLDSLDDSDHDIIFRKNLSQFRKKIVSPVKTDSFQKSVVRSRKRKGKFVRSEDILEEVIQEACDLEDAPSGLENKMIDVFRFEYSQVWKHRLCCGKTFGTFFLALLEGGLVVRALGVRTEWGTVDALQTVRVLSERRKGKHVPFDVVEDFKFGGLPSRILSGIKAYEAISALMSADLEDGTSASNQQDPDGPYRGGTESFYVIPEHLFAEIAQKSDGNLKVLNAHKTSRFFFESSGAIGKNKSEGDGERELKLSSRKKDVVKFTQSCVAPRMIVQMLCCPASDCTTVFCDKLAFPGGPPRSRSEPNMRNRIEPKTRTPVTITWASNKMKTCSGHERSGELSVGSELRLDGFQVIYNNSRDSLNDEEDDAAKPAFSGTKHDFLLSAKPHLLSELKNCCPGCSESLLPESRLGADGKKLRHKSNSSPEECVNQTEFGLHEYRPRRSLNLSRELEKDVECYRRKRLAVDKPATGAEETFRKFVFAVELKSLLESEWKGPEQNASATSEKSEANVRKEISTAFESLKEITLSKSEQRKSGSGRMSLVIVLSKK